MLNLQKAINLFLGEHTPATEKSYKYVLRALRDYVGPARPLLNVTTADLLEFMHAIKDRPDVHSPATYNKYVKTIRTFFNWCIRLNLLDSASPAAGLKRMRESRDRKKAMSDELYEQLIEYARALAIAGRDHRALAFLLFIGDTGCRIGGAANLRWNEVHFDQSFAEVLEKDQQRRAVFFGEECLSALKRWRGRHSMRRGDYVFSRSGGKMLTANLSQYFRRLCQRAEIGSWGPHSLRHRKGYQLADAMIPATTAAQVLGNSVDIMLRYYYPQDLERVQQVMRDLAWKPGRFDATKIRKFRSK